MLAILVKFCKYQNYSSGADMGIIQGQFSFRCLATSHVFPKFCFEEIFCVSSIPFKEQFNLNPFALRMAKTLGVLAILSVIGLLEWICF